MGLWPQRFGPSPHRHVAFPVSVRFPSPFSGEDTWHWVRGPPESSVTFVRTPFPNEVTFTEVRTSPTSARLSGGTGCRRTAGGTTAPRLALHPALTHSPHYKLPEHFELELVEGVSLFQNAGGAECLCPLPRPLPHSSTWISGGHSSPLGPGPGAGPGPSPPERPSAVPEGSVRGWIAARDPPGASHSGPLPERLAESVREAAKA